MSFIYSHETPLDPVEVVGARENGRARGRHARGETPATQASLCVQSTPDNSNLREIAKSSRHREFEFSRIKLN